MPTFWNSPLPIEAEQWDGTPDALAKLSTLLGAALRRDGDVLWVTLASGREHELQIGEWPYVDEYGVAVRVPERVGEWLTEDPRAA